MSGLLHVNIADHKGVFCINNDSELFSSNTTKSKREFNKKNIAQFNKSMINESWDYAYSSDFKSAFSWFQQTFDRYFDKSFPVLAYKINYKNRHPWMTEQLRNRIKQKNSLYLTVLNHPGDIKLKEQYKRQKNQLNSDIKNTEINYYSNELELHKENLRKTWKIIKSIIGKDTTNSNQNRTFCINGKNTTNVSKIVNEFNNFFVSVGVDLAKNIKCSVNPLSYVNTLNNICIVLPEISIAEVTNVIRSLKESSPGWDNIPAFILKQCIGCFVKPLTHIINRSFIEGIFPKELKLARVVPIYKAGDSTSITNYRPISILTCFSKIFEKIIYNHVTAFFDSNQIIYKYQFGFRKEHSTQQAIISLVEKITRSLDSRDIVIGIFLDLKKSI